MRNRQLKTFEECKYLLYARERKEKKKKREIGKRYKIYSGKTITRNSDGRRRNERKSGRESWNILAYDDLLVGSEESQKEGFWCEMDDVLYFASVYQLATEYFF